MIAMPRFGSHTSWKITEAPIFRPSSMPAAKPVMWPSGDMGADVIKVEPPEGELGRKLGPGWIGNDSAVFHAVNRNKRGISLDLKCSGDRSAARKLVAQADVLVESMRPGVMKRLGLGPEELCAERPKLIYCSISAYGQQEPYARYAGVDGVLQADMGLMGL